MALSSLTLTMFVTVTLARIVICKYNHKLGYIIVLHRPINYSQLSIMVSQVLNIGLRIFLVQFPLSNDAYCIFPFYFSKNSKFSLIFVIFRFWLPLL